MEQAALDLPAALSPITGRMAGKACAPASGIGPQASGIAEKWRKRQKTRPAGQWDLDNAITAVLFAGLGGACDGLEDAGFHVHVCNNHDPVALAAHAAKHPHARHIKGSIFDVDPVEATGGRRVRALWASPDCTDHSVAKGGAPRSPRVRSLPWQVLRWAAKTGAEVIMMENVREIRGWGPLVAKRDRATGRVVKQDGTIAAPGERVPVRQQQLVRDKQRMGKTFRRFVAELKGLGYHYQDRDLCLADYGIPTTRSRWFAVARRDGQPIGWPVRTHAPRGKAEALGLLPRAPLYPLIDWSLPMTSIFERSKPMATASLRRIAAGLHRFVLDSAEPFLIHLTHHGADRIHPVSGPMPTVICAHSGELAVVAPLLTELRGRSTAQPVTEPLAAQTTRSHHALVSALMVQMGYEERPGQTPRVLDLLEPIGTMVAGGGKHALVSAWGVQHNTGVVGHHLEEPLSTLTTSGTQQQLAAAYLMEFRGTSEDGQPVTDPAPTICTGGGRGGGHAGLVAAFLMEYYSAGGQHQSLRDPLNTVSTKGRFGLVTVTIDGRTYVITDIRHRMLQPEEMAAAHELTLPEFIVVDGKRRRLTKTEATRLIGNSVPKRIARLIAEANLKHPLGKPMWREAA